jgi:hypothetical protein
VGEILEANEHAVVLEFILGISIADGVNAAITPERGSKTSPFLTFVIQEQAWTIHA